ncbi:calexcitin-2-like [Haliotis cracherodii]|uniref:calexcitin-2-like n=1 Tax=Haliotis cracherodii TaxID=6455 RepID=UPI0039E8E29B
MAMNGTVRTGNSLTEFQSRKQEYIFDTLYDITHDRNLSRQDFTKLQKLVTGIKGLSGRCEQSRALQTRMASIWSGLMKSSKHYRKNPLQLHLSLPEWLSYWSDFVKAASKSRDWPASSIDDHAVYDWHVEFVDFVFDVMDINSDSVIDKEEYISSLTQFSVPADNCHQSYNKLSQALNGEQLSRDHFRQFWFRFLVSDDPAEVGNFLFGDPTQSTKASSGDS